jgi:hypothetical protein
MKRYFLEYCKDPLQRTFFTLGEFTHIGRMEGNNICLEDPEISRRHARVVLQGGDCVLYDLGSRNGTFVNGLKVRSRVLKHGDAICMGQTNLRFVEADELARTIAMENTREGLLMDFPQEAQDPLHLARTFLEPLPIGVALINPNMEVLYCNGALASFLARGVYRERGRLGHLLGCCNSQGGDSTCGASSQCLECPFLSAASRVFGERVPTVEVELHWQGDMMHSAAHFRFSLLPLPYLFQGEALAQLILEGMSPGGPVQKDRGGPDARYYSA